MHVLADDVFGKADFRRVIVAGDDAARHGVGFLDVAFGGEVLKGAKPAASGHDTEGLALLADNEGLQQAMGFDGGGEFVDAVLGDGLADVAFPEGELVQRQVGDVSHGWILLKVLGKSEGARYAPASAVASMTSSALSLGGISTWRAPLL